MLHILFLYLVQQIVSIKTQDISLKMYHLHIKTHHLQYKIPIMIIKIHNPIHIQHMHLLITQVMFIQIQQL